MGSLNVIIDTGTWLKLDLLENKKLFTTQSVYEWTKVIITHQVEEEIVHFKCSSYVQSETQVVPIGNRQIYDEIISIGFDEADASIASLFSSTSNENERKENLIAVTEDKPLLDYLHMKEIYAIQLVELFLIFTDMRKIQGKEFYRLVKILQDLRNITKKKMNSLLAWKVNHT
jgi:hypothetical protein